MDITLERTALAKALSTVDRIVERRNTIPILGNVALYADAGSLRLKATDLDIEASTRAQAVIATPGQVTVPVGVLSGIVNKLPDGAQVTIATQPNGQIALRAGRSRFMLQTLPIEDFPDLPVTDMEHSFDLAPKVLAEMIERTRFAISTEETRYYLNGIYLHVVTIEGVSYLRAVATDGHRLACFEIPAPEGSEGMPAIIVPRKTVGEFSRITKDAEPGLRLEVSKAKIRLTCGIGQLVSKLIDGNFPDYQRVIPQANDKVATIDAADFARAVDLVSAITSERSQPVKLSLEPGVLHLSVTNQDTGEARQDIEADYDGPPVEIGFKAKYLTEALGAIGGDTIELKLADGGAPAILQPKADSRLLVVLMPMRV